LWFERTQTIVELLARTRNLGLTLDIVDVFL
jgi:hypothetical protein